MNFYLQKVWIILTHRSENYAHTIVQKKTATTIRTLNPLLLKVHDLLVEYTSGIVAEKSKKGMKFIVERYYRLKVIAI